MNVLNIPVEDPNVLEVTSTASSQQAITLNRASSDFLPGIYRFECDDDIWIRFSVDEGDVDDPVISDETADGDTCHFFPKGWNLVRIKAGNVNFKAIVSSGTTYLRYIFEQGI